MTDYRLYWSWAGTSRARLHVHRRGGGGGLWSELDLLHEPPVLDYCDAGALFRAAGTVALADIAISATCWTSGCTTRTRTCPRRTGRCRMAHGGCGDVLVSLLRWPGYPSDTILDDMDCECETGIR